MVLPVRFTGQVFVHISFIPNVFSCLMYFILSGLFMPVIFFEE